MRHRHAVMRQSAAVVVFLGLVGQVLCPIAGCKKAAPPPPGPATGAMPTTVATAPRLTQLVSQQIVPNQVQTVEAKGHLKVTVPKDLLASPTTLTLSSVADPPPPNNDLLVPGPTYDVSLGNLHALPAPVTIEMPCPPGAVRKDCPAQRAYTAAYYDTAMKVWVDLPCELDKKAGMLTIRTDHLCMVRANRVKDDCELVWEEGPLTFVVAYNRKTVLADKEFYGVNVESTAGQPETPRYIRDMVWSVRNAITQYGNYGFMPQNRFMWVYVQGNESPISYGLTGNIQLPLLYNNRTDMSRAVAHEMFHNVQYRYYRLPGVMMHRWWMECTAEYAASRIAVKDYSRMGTEDSPMAPNYLAASIVRVTASGDTAWPSHQEQAAHYIDFICRAAGSQAGVTPQAFFADLFKAVAPKTALETDEYDLPRVNKFVTSQVPATDATKLYDQFVLDFLFNQGSPMGVKDRVRMPPEACDATWMAKQGDPVQRHSFDLNGGFSARAWGLRVKPPEGKSSLQLQISGKALPHDVRLLAYLLPGNTREPDTGQFMRSMGPRCTDITGQPFTTELLADDGLYIVAINHRVIDVMADVELAVTDSGQWNLVSTDHDAKPIKSSAPDIKTSFTSVAGTAKGECIADYTHNGLAVHKEVKGKITWQGPPARLLPNKPEPIKVECTLEGDLDKTNISTAMEFNITADMIEIRPAWHKVGADATKPASKETFTLKLPPAYPGPGQKVRLPVTFEITMPFAGTDKFVCVYEWTPPKPSRGGGETAGGPAAGQ